MVTRFPIAFARCGDSLPVRYGDCNFCLRQAWYRCTQMASDVQADIPTEHGCQL